MSLIGTMGSGVSALRTFSKGLEVIGNNIANVNTTGFKSSSAKFADSFSNILERSSPAAGTAASDAGNIPYTGIGTGVRLAGITSNFSQGSLASTGKGTDLGISGNGFFRVKNGMDGQEYATRAGDFRWDDRGFLVNSQGFHVQGFSGTGLATVGDVKFGTPPAGTQLQSVTVDRFGSVIEFYSDGSSATTNQIALQNYKDPSALTREGNNLFSGLVAAGPVGAAAGTATLTAATNTPGSDGLGTIQAGALELSNVDLTEQFAELITMQRSFQAGSRLVTLSDSVLQEIVELKR